jgi:hypothetical protein
VGIFGFKEKKINLPSALNVKVLIGIDQKLNLIKMRKNNGNSRFT